MKIEKIKEANELIKKLEKTQECVNKLDKSLKSKDNNSCYITQYSDGSGWSVDLFGVITPDEIILDIKEKLNKKINLLSEEIENI